MKAKTKTRTISLLTFVILLSALVAFEIFNFGTTRNVLTSMLGVEKFVGLGIAVWLAIALCSMDIGGLARMFTEEKSFNKESSGVQVMFVAWIGAALINAALTYWFLSEYMTFNVGYIPPLFSNNLDNVAIGLALAIFGARLIIVFVFASIMDVNKVSFNLPSLPNLNPKKGKRGVPSNRGYSPSALGSSHVTGLQQLEPDNLKKVT